MLLDAVKALSALKQGLGIKMDANRSRTETTSPFGGTQARLHDLKVIRKVAAPGIRSSMSSKGIRAKRHLLPAAPSGPLARRSQLSSCDISFAQRRRSTRKTKQIARPWLPTCMPPRGRQLTVATRTNSSSLLSHSSGQPFATREASIAHALTTSHGLTFCVQVGNGHPRIFHGFGAHGREDALVRSTTPSILELTTRDDVAHNAVDRPLVRGLAIHGQMAVGDHGTDNVIALTAQLPTAHRLMRRLATAPEDTLEHRRIQHSTGNIRNDASQEHPVVNGGGDDGQEHPFVNGGGGYDSEHPLVNGEGGHTQQHSLTGDDVEGPHNQQQQQ